MDVRPGGAEQRAPARAHVRLLHGMRRPANWLQLIRFGLVGGERVRGQPVVYALLVHVLERPLPAGCCCSRGWSAVTNNFVLNRHWTFDASAGRAPPPGACASSS